MTDQPPPKEPKKAPRKSAAVTAISRNVKSISNIVQLRGSFKVRLDADQELTSCVLEAPAEANQDGAKIVVVVAYRFIASKGEQEPSKDPIVDVGAIYEITYELKDETQRTKSDLLLFAEINGRFNAAPYWREYLSSSLIRAGLSPYFAPPFNAADRLRELDKSPAADPDKPLSESPAN